MNDRYFSGLLRDRDGKPLATYSVEIDWQSLNAMAQKAYKSRGQKSVDGPITLTILKKVEGTSK
jgi:hypothetical protein